MTALPTKFDLPDRLPEKVNSFGESSYGATIVTLVLKDGRQIEHVHVAWARNVIKASRPEDDVFLNQLDPVEIVDVISET